MATTVLAYPPSNDILPGSQPLREAPFPNAESISKCLQTPGLVSPGAVTEEWVSSFLRLLDGEQISVARLFTDQSCWRDLLCMSWDYHTLQGLKNISSHIKRSTNTSRITRLEPCDSPTHKVPQLATVEGVQVVQAFLNIETSSGLANGLVRLTPDPDDGGRWKAWTLFTTLKAIKGHEELTGDNRPTGEREHEHLNWKDRRSAQQNFEGGREPDVLILGAGQAGLTVAARLKQLGLESLIIDSNARIGDNWRRRYHQLVLHDSVWFDHMPYLPFPSNWPKFTPKDKLADWFEYYAGILELNVWMSTNLSQTLWDDNTREWKITVVRSKGIDKEERTLHPKHVILATGHSGEPYLPDNITGLDKFKGDRLIHSSQFEAPDKDGHGKKAVVIGCCNSGHDIARDFYDYGYDVTMVQRSSTLVHKSQTLLDVSMKGVYDEHGPPVDDADVINFSFPSPVAKRLQKSATAEIMRRDSALLDALSAAGFSLDSGPDSSGIWVKYLSRGGGYYIDVGASQLIADKKIKIKQGQEVTAIKEHSIVFADGGEIEVDEIVFATGFQNMRETAKKIFGKEATERMSEVWGYDEEGETRGMWRPSGHPGFWFMGGNLALCRFYSRLLALQIKAVELGLSTP